MRAYIAGPLFNEGERWWDEQINQVVRNAGFTTFLPHANIAPGGPGLKGPDDLARIFKADTDAIDASDIVVANLNGITSDDGTAWELGYAYAKGKHLVGVYTDWRLQFEHQIVNLMLQCSLNKLCRSLPELEAYLREYVDSLKGS